MGLCFAKMIDWCKTPSTVSGNYCCDHDPISCQSKCCVCYFGWNKRPSLSSKNVTQSTSSDNTVQEIKVEHS